MKSLGKIVAATALALSLGTSAAYADGCTGRDHTKDTLLGAGAGALTGGLIGGDLAGAAVGGIAGGLIGNTISRNQDCNNVRAAQARRAAAARQAANRPYYVDRNGLRHYYNRR